MKYVILDFGGVLVYPPTGSWTITPKFLELIDKNKLDNEKAMFNAKKNSSLTDCARPLKTLEEEYEAMVSFYDLVLSNSYEGYEKRLSEEIAKDRVYQFEKYKLYDGVIEELERLSREYSLILLSDNWPSCLKYMKHYGIDKYFTRIYISSFYGTKKEEGTFFDILLKDVNIKPENAVFIDDHSKNLDIAKTKGIQGILMDRENKQTNSNYYVIHSLKELGEKIERTI